MTSTIEHGIPAIGFGTFGRTGDPGVEAILYSLETGYRHIDTAQTYNTEAECGRAIKASGLKRHEVFVTTKITSDNYGPGRLVPSLKRSCDNLGLDAVDLALIHWPAPPSGPIPIRPYLEQLAEARDLGLTRLIGVSNFTIAHLTETIEILGRQTIACNQFELHPYLQNRKLAGFCASQDIGVTCYCPLGQGIVANDPVLAEIGRTHGVPGTEIALAFLMAKGYAVIPTSGKKERIRSNFHAASLTLSPQEIVRIDGLDRGQRVIRPSWGPDWD